MPYKHYLFTSESVTEGHPDKIADQISDAVLDAIYAKDPMARVACETASTTGLILVIGEITTDISSRRSTFWPYSSRLMRSYGTRTCVPLV